MRHSFCTFMMAASLSMTAVDAQISTATLVGTVNDASGSVVANARVEARNLGTGMARNAISDITGAFTIPNLPAAHYSVTVTAPGFKIFTMSDIELQVAQQAMVNPVLEVGVLGQEVTVSAAAPLLATSSSSVGQVVNPLSVERMPLNGRSFWQLTQLTPGASYNPGGANIRSGGSSIRATAVNVTINGTSPIWIGWSLDGANITEMQLGGTLVQPNVDALQEFKVESANMPAEYGHTPTLINASLKSGTNGFHGDLFEFVRNSKFDARNFFYLPPPGSNLTNEPLRRNQFGGTVGGPIRKDHTFFFADVERTSLRQGQDFNNVVPSVAMRKGDFSELLRGSKPQQIVDPLTREPYPGNIIPPALIAPQAAFFLKYLPQPNLLQGATSRAVLTNNLGQDLTRTDVKIDQQLTAEDQLSGRYSINDNNESDPNSFPAMGTYALHSRAQSAMLTDTHIFGARWLSSTRVSYYRSIFLFGGALQGTNVDREAGILGFDNTTPAYGAPQINISGFAGYTGSPFDQRPKSNRIRNWQYAENVSYSGGRHSAKFGAELMHETAGFFNGSRAVGVFNFLGAYTGNAFADFLLGYPDNVQGDYFKQINGDYGNFWSFFAQDNYRLTPDLTLNVGLRAELNSFYNGIRGQKSAFDLVNGKLVIPSDIDIRAQPLMPQLLPLFQDRIVYTKQLGRPTSIQPRELDWAPRLGLAWRPAGSDWLVVRAAYGIFQIFPDSNTIDNTVATVPFVASQTVFNDRAPLAPTRTWANFFQGQTAFSPNTNPDKPCAFGFAALSCATPDVDASALDFHTTYMQQWNVSVQRQISASNSIDLAYVGNKTTRLNQNLRINDPLPGAGAIQPRRPYAQWGSITYPVFEENADYNSLQAKFESRGWHGLNLLAAYAFSKCLDGGSGEGGTTLALLRFNRAVCDYDLPQNFAGSFDYALPIGKGHWLLGGARGVLNQLAGGWEFAGILTLRSGLPFTPTIIGDRANTGLSDQRPDLVGAPVQPHNLSCWFYTSANPGCLSLATGTIDAFVLPPSQQRYGTSGRNILRADGLKELDFTVVKNFPVSEASGFELRGEFFNLFNHPTFAAPSAAVNNASGGQIGSTLNGPRLIQLALKFRF